MPPSLEQAEHEIEPNARARHLEEHQHAVIGEARFEIAERMLQVGGRVDDVGGEDQVVAVKVDPLGVRRLLDIEGLVVDERVLGEALLGRGDEGRAVVGEGELGAVGWQEW